MTSVLQLSCLLGVGLALTASTAPGGIIQYGNPSSVILVRSLPQPNPTSFVFAASLAQLHATLQEANISPLEGRNLETRESVDRSLFPYVYRLLSRAGNEDDGYIRCRPGDGNDQTPLYSVPALKYSLYGVELHVHLTAIDPGHTRVDVQPHRPWIYAGERERGFFPFYWHRRGIFVKARPTTIEEYRLLQKLGAVLGVQDMPPLVLPDGAVPPMAKTYRDDDIIDLDWPDLYEREWTPSY